MNSILQRIADHKKTEVHQAKKQRPIASLALSEALAVRDFIGSLLSKKTSILAEIKKASPSKGLIRADFDVASIAHIYETYGASCLSVLTDISFFQGDPSYLATAKSNCHLPILRKDFIIDEYQVHESRALGADCILLIAALLDDQKLHDYCQTAQELGMAVLVESHTEEELQRALRIPTPLMGINNRSLHTFATDLNTSICLSKLIPFDKIIITESGIHHHDDIQLMQSHGIHTFLIGEQLMQAQNIGLELNRLLNGIIN